MSKIKLLTAILSLTLVTTVAFAGDATTTQIVAVTSDDAASSTVTSLPVATTTETISTSTEEIANEEVDQEDVQLGDNKAELDSKKDFTAVVRQSKDYYCGPASLATLLTQLGIDTSEQAILDLIKPVDLNSASGTNLLALKNASISLGNKTYLKKWDVETILKYISTTDDPVLIHDEKKGVGGHFSVIKSYKDGIVELSDTEAGNIKYSVEDFKHIYTGDALVISSDTTNELLNDTTTDMSDEVAANIWGKYVPVYILATESGNTAAVNAANAFKVCIQNALTYSTVARRNAERTNCYNVLAKAVGGALTNTQELFLEAKYGLYAFSNSDYTNEIGVNAITSILTQKLNANKLLLSQKQADFNTKYTAYTNAQNPLTLQNLVNAYNKAVADKSLLASQISTKQTSINSLNSEINGGTFTQNGVTFSLGVIGSQVSAQSSSFSKLSASLSTTLSSLSGQITSAQNSLNNANANYTAYNNQYNNYNSQYSSQMNNYYSYSSQYNSAVASRDYFLAQYNRSRTSYNYSNYQAYASQASSALNNKNNAYNQAMSYQSQANNALSNRNWWAQQVANYTNTISSLNSQKSNASAQISNAQAELDRLNRLKSFGDQEIQRKKGVLATMQSELLVLNFQLATAVNNVNTLPAQIATLKTQIASQGSAQKLVIDNLKIEIDNLQKEVDAQIAEVANESTFERTNDVSAEKVATQDLRGSVNESLSYAKNNPGSVALIAGGAVIYVGGSAACIAYTAGACAPFVEAANVALLSYTVYDTVNSTSKILTQKDLFGNVVSDVEWTSALTSLQLNIALTGITAASLKATTLASKSPMAAKALVNKLLYGTATEKVAATNEIKALVPVSKLIPLGKGSTADNITWFAEGRTLGEKLVLSEIKANPALGKVISVPMSDMRWPVSEGWNKLTYLKEFTELGQTLKSEVHFVAQYKNGAMVAIDDFKIQIISKVPLK